MGEVRYVAQAVRRAAESRAGPDPAGESSRFALENTQNLKVVGNDRCLTHRELPSFPPHVYKRPLADNARFMPS